jgi:predicted AAA+ superfamily ATPase
MIRRDKYLQMLIDSRNNGFPKVITGIRRCGKSYLLKEIYTFIDWYILPTEKLFFFRFKTYISSD